VYCHHDDITDDKLNGTKEVPDSRAGVREFREPRHRFSGAPNISGVSVWNLFHVIVLAPRILIWLLDLRTFCVHLF